MGWKDIERRTKSHYKGKLQKEKEKFYNEVKTVEQRGFLNAGIDLYYFRLQWNGKSHNQYNLSDNVNKIFKIVKGDRVINLTEIDEITNLRDRLNEFHKHYDDMIKKLKRQGINL